MVNVQTYQPGATLITRIFRFFGIIFQVKRMWLYIKYDKKTDRLVGRTRCNGRFGIRVFKDREDFNDGPTGDDKEAIKAKEEYLKHKKYLKRSGKTEKYLLACR